MAGWILNLFGVIISLVCNLSGGLTLTVTPDKGTTITISRQGTGGSSCNVCVKEGSKQQCTTNLTLSNDQEILLDFTCDSPERLFTVDFKRKIVCKGTVCDGDITQKEPPLFRKFNRTFTWDLTPDRPRSFQLAFSSMGMRQIPPSETCPDQHTYTVTVTQPTGNATIGTFCQNGSISSIQALSQSRVVLQVPGGRSLDPNVFRVSVGPEIKTFAVVKVTVPDGTSTAEFFSPNYPGSFPDDDLMTWDFQFPPRHNFTMRFLNYTEPQCVKKEVVVEYHRPSTVFIGKRLTDPQPANRQGDFSLFLRNCEMERSAMPGLSLHFQVSVVKTRISGKCDVDLQKEKGVTLQIEKRNLNSNCTMKLNEKVQNMVTMASGSISKLFFQDCQIEELMVTVSKSIECQQWEGCRVSGVPLSVPTLPACLPIPLHNITWHLSVPDHGTVELLHPGANLHQVQIHSNVSVTATPTLGGDLHQASKPFLKVSFHQEIVESYIFTVVPQKGVPVRLATPGWPEGMKASSTVSWIVTVPPKYQANLLFLNISQPKCKQQHTHMKVQTLGSREEMFSRREDEARATS
ncbi:hypothetical protein AGOR_G00205670 [Albula goreensis]|uniref:CUB domain-containing protein 1-like n=1 Tax=Albula goreensis TaxID=1534307 RepID=A0A8T3CP40_9TELE|nr:hypothetical protein AGOR_G00205670 [Albula goreensis]